jgi:hypothetical protein
VFVAAAAPSASAQHVVYPPPVVYHQPTVTYGTPVMQSGQWVRRPVFRVPESNRPLSRPLWSVSGRDGFGVPFNNRPLLNIAYRLAW